MRTPFLYGEFELTIDEKNRLLVPAEIRKLIHPELDGEAFFLTVGMNRVPWLYPERYYQELVSQQISPEITPSPEALEYIQLKFAMASRVEWDKQGRLVIPEKILKRTGLAKEVTLCGMRDHLELWNRADWEARRESLFERSPEIELRAKQVRQTP